MKKIIWHGCLQKQGTELSDPRVPSNLLFLIRYMSIMGALLASSLFLQEDPFICVTSQWYPCKSADPHWHVGDMDSWIKF